MPTGSDSIPGTYRALQMIRSERVLDELFQADEGDPCRFKRWAVRPLFLLDPAYSVSPLGDAHRGARTWPCAAVSNLGEPAAPTPPSGGFLIVRSNAVFI